MEVSRDVLRLIFEYLTLPDLMVALRVCKGWCNVGTSEKLWEILFKKDFEKFEAFYKRFELSWDINNKLFRDLYKERYNFHNNLYLTEVRALPKPTDTQIENFVTYVMGAHSWYKHLPVREYVPFVFFLNPVVAMNYDANDKKFLSRVRGDGTEFHYTWMPTTDYRDKYACLDYFDGDPLAVSSVQDVTLPIPVNLKHYSTAFVNAMFHIRSDSYSMLDASYKELKKNYEKPIEERRNFYNDGFNESWNFRLFNDQKGVSKFSKEVVDNMFSLLDFNSTIAEQKDPIQYTDNFLHKLFPAINDTFKKRLVENHQSTKTLQFSPNILVVAEQLRQKKECIEAVNRMLSVVYK